MLREKIKKITFSHGACSMGNQKTFSHGTCPIEKVKHISFLHGARSLAMGRPYVALRILKFSQLEDVLFGMPLESSGITLLGMPWGEASKVDSWSLELKLRGLRLKLRCLELKPRGLRLRLKYLAVFKFEAESWSSRLKGEGLWALKAYMLKKSGWSLQLHVFQESVSTCKFRVYSLPRLKMNTYSPHLKF